MTTDTVSAGAVCFGRGHPLALIAGPCVIESESHALFMAEAISNAARRAGLPYVYKSSFDKANRTSVDAFRGIGREQGLRILEKVKRETGVPVLTDVHQPEDVTAAAQIVDILQIPAFLCRQTDLLLSAGQSGKPVNIKKGQFLAPWDMKQVVQKVASTGNHQILLTERGATFGYNNLVVDFRSLAIMANIGYPVIFDATHSVQLPGAMGKQTGGERRYVEPLARAAAAFGCNGVFLEVHDHPDSAPCDGPNMLELKNLPRLLEALVAADQIARHYAATDAATACLARPTDTCEQGDAARD